MRGGRQAEGTRLAADHLRSHTTSPIDIAIVASADRTSARCDGRHAPGKAQRRQFIPEWLRAPPIDPITVPVARVRDVELGLTAAKSSRTPVTVCRLIVLSGVRGNLPILKYKERLSPCDR